MITPKSLQSKFGVGITQFIIFIAVFYALAGFSGCEFAFTSKPEEVWDTLTVNASAYNSLKYQTGPGDPNVTAFGDTLEPGMKIIAVSRDLLKGGLKYNTRVKIKGFRGEYLVKDKMHYRWKNKIDIYMGEDVKRARKWGRKKIEIYYTSAHEDEQDLSLTK
jgi:3D (Asp-Asp-Asp) domain-containing protein